MKIFFKFFGQLLLVMIMGFLIWAYTNLRDRNPDYKADLKIINTKAAGFYGQSV